MNCLKIIKNHETEFKFKINNLLNSKYKYPGFKYRDISEDKMRAYDIPALPTSFSFKIIQHF